MNPRLSQVLVLLAADRSRRQIATELCVAPATVAGYLKDLYAVLGVHGASEAVTRARELGLVAAAEPDQTVAAMRRVVELVLARDFETAYSEAVEVAAFALAAEPGR